MLFLDSESYKCNEIFGLSYSKSIYKRRNTTDKTENELDSFLLKEQSDNIQCDNDISRCRSLLSDQFRIDFQDSSEDKKQFQNDLDMFLLSD